MTATSEPPAQPAPSANDMLTTCQIGTSTPAPLFSEEAVQDAHRHLHVERGDPVDDEERVECFAVTLGIGMWNCRILSDARIVLAAPGVRREVEARWQDGYMAAHESATDALLQEVHARCEAEAESARLASALEEARGRIAAALRLADTQGEDSYVMVHALRAALSGDGETGPALDWWACPRCGWHSMSASREHECREEPGRG